MLWALPATAVAQKTVHVAPPGTTGSSTVVPCGATAETPCGSVQAALASANGTDTLQFSAGTFPITSATVIGKPLILKGARAGVPGSDRNPTDTTADPAETILSPATTLAEVLKVDAAGVTVDGFTFTNSRDSGGLWLCCKGSGRGGHTVINNIFSGNRYGMFPQVSGAPSMIAANLFLKSGSPAGALNGNGIYTDQAVNLTVSGNVFQDNRTSAVITTGPNQNVTWTGNTHDGDRTGLVLLGVKNSSFTDNRFQGGAGGAFLLYGYGSGNEKLDIAGNKITDKGSYGIWFSPLEGPPTPNTDITIRENSITGTRNSGSAGSGYAIRIDDGMVGGDLRITRNRIAGNASGGLRDADDTAAVLAERNWWGCNLGPGTTGCDEVVNPGGGPAPDTVPVADSVTGPARRHAGARPGGAGAGHPRRRQHRPARPAGQPEHRRPCRRPVLRRRPRRVLLHARRRHVRPAHRDPERRHPASRLAVHRRGAAERTGRHRRQSAGGDRKLQPARGGSDPRYPPVGSDPHARPEGRRGDRARQPRQPCRPAAASLHAPGGQVASLRPRVPADRAAATRADDRLPGHRAGPGGRLPRPAPHRITVSYAGLSRPLRDSARGRLLAGACGNPPCPTVSAARAAAARRQPAGRPPRPYARAHDASDVDLPEPVGPVTEHDPARLGGKPAHDRRRPSCSIGTVSDGISRIAAPSVPRWKNVLTRKRPTPGTL